MVLAALGGWSGISRWVRQRENRRGFQYEEKTKKLERTSLLADRDLLLLRQLRHLTAKGIPKLLVGLFKNGLKLTPGMWSHDYISNSALLPISRLDLGELEDLC